MPTKNELLRQIPSIDQLVASPEASRALERFDRELVVDCLREAVDGLRAQVLAAPGEEGPEGVEVTAAAIAGEAETIVRRLFQPNLQRVINATGVVIHTNLGRSILSVEACEAVQMAARNYSNLEFDIGSGARGSRHSHVETLLRGLTGAEAGMVVNNNAAAVLLALAALADGKESIVSRGQLVEIGGSFRIPDVMSQSGSILREVGATNKTHLADYEAAIGERTGLLLRVHPSNFKMMGFTTEVSLEELVELGAKRGIPVMEDLGSGVLVDLSSYGLPFEPTVQHSVASGADVVTFSGDKLLGGPQAGVVVGKTEAVARMKKHPLARALRVDKMTLAALEATLRGYLNPARVLEDNPTVRMITVGRDELARQAQGLAEKLSALADHFDITCEDEISRAGGGALPMTELPTVVVALKPKTARVEAIEAALRTGTPHVIARVKEDRLLLDPRTIQTGEDDEVLTALTAAMGRSG